MQSSLNESARTLNAAIATDVAVMRQAANASAVGDPDRALCDRLTAALNGRDGGTRLFALFGPASSPVCNSPGFAPRRPSTLGPDSRTRAMISGDTVEIVVSVDRGGATVLAHYSADALGAIAKPALSIPYSLALASDASVLNLRRSGRLPVQSDTMTAPVGSLGMSLTLSVPKTRLTATTLLLTFLPLLMWASAALIGFLVVERLLILPLRTLRFAVASHLPGTVFRPPSLRTPAREIRELGETFALFGEQIGKHEIQLATALADQTRATREVHHRVKNNLQVIASLISLHARGAQSPDAASAYAAIQRRVDALSIVHRNHYAELDSLAGIDILGLLGELASALRASAAVESAAPAITIAAPRLGVSQDCAVAISFLLTELVELSTSLDPAASIAITVQPPVVAQKARLSLTSNALKDTPRMRDRLAGRYARVIEGLSRQLRSGIVHDFETGRISIDFAVIDREAKILEK